jgi:hypothetical protein
MVIFANSYLSDLVTKVLPVNLDQNWFPILLLLSPIAIEEMFVKLLFGLWESKRWQWLVGTGSAGLLFWYFGRDWLAKLIVNSVNPPATEIMAARSLDSVSAQALTAEQVFLLSLAIGWILIGGMIITVLFRIRMRRQSV